MQNTQKLLTPDPPWIPELPPNTIVSAVFSPGYSSDYTSWRTNVGRDGDLSQRISWHGGKTEVRNGKMDPEQLTRLIHLLESISQAGLDLIHQKMWVCDAPEVVLSSPLYDVNSKLSIWRIGQRRDWLHEDSLKPFDSFVEAWELIEENSPYSTSQHWRKD